MNTKSAFYVVAGALLLLLVGIALAAELDFGIDWWTADGGGGAIRLESPDHSFRGPGGVGLQRRACLGQLRVGRIVHADRTRIGLRAFLLPKPDCDVA